jgi:hypothetical protein
MKTLLVKKLFWIFLLVGLGWVGKPAVFAYAQEGKPGTPTPAQSPGAAPSGFQKIASASGVVLYKKDYPNGNPDFVQVIDLSQGASLELLYGNITEPRPTKGSFGGPDPRMTSTAMSTFWRQTLDHHKQEAFCVANGTFFYMPEYPTRLAFPLKVNGEMITEGFGVNTYEGEHMMLELWDDHANIREMDQSSLYESTAPNILGGLTEEANKRAKFAVGRTFVGVADRDGDGSLESVLVLTTRTALQTGAAGVLREFGAQKVMMLDGGGSTQLTCKSGEYIQSDRPVPQAIAAIAATPPPVSIELLGQIDWPVLLIGEGFPLQLNIRNTGTISWTQSTTQYVVQVKPLGIPYLLPMNTTVAPGQNTVLKDTLTVFRDAGIYRVEVEWGIYYKDKRYPGKPVHTYAVVLPGDMQDQRQTLEDDIQRWKREAPDQIETRLKTWMKEQMATPLPVVEAAELTDNNTRQESIHMADAIWIPILMLPIVIVLGFAIARRSS